MRKIHSPKFDLADAMAIKALALGTADEVAQRRAFTWIVHGVAQIQKLSYVPESDRDTAFAEGRRSVGLELVLYAQTPADDLKRIAESRRST